MLTNKLFYSIKEKLEAQSQQPVEVRTTVQFPYDGGKKTIHLTWDEELSEEILAILGRARVRVKTH